MPNSYYRSQVLPEVRLSAEEERDLYDRYCTEDDFRALERLIESQLKITLSIVGRHLQQQGRGMSEYAEMVSRANAIVVETIQTKRFDPSKGRLSTFLSKRIRGALVEAFWSSNAISYPSGSTQWLSPAEENVEFLQCVSDPVGEQADHHLVRCALEDVLTEEEQQVLQLIYLEQHLTSEVARIMNLMSSTTYEIRDRALAKMKKALTPFFTSPNKTAALAGVCYSATVLCDYLS